MQCGFRATWPVANYLLFWLVDCVALDAFSRSSLAAWSTVSRARKQTAEMLESARNSDQSHIANCYIAAAQKRRLSASRDASDVRRVADRSYQKGDHRNGAVICDDLFHSTPCCAPRSGERSEVTWSHLAPEFRTVEVPWPGSRIGADQEGKGSLREGHYTFTTQAIRKI